MKAWQGRSWSWDIDGLSLHNYTVVKWPPALQVRPASARRSITEILKSTLEMDRLIATHSAIMDKYDPQKKVALLWSTSGARGTRRCPAADPGFLVQQNSHARRRARRRST